MLLKIAIILLISTSCVICQNASCIYSVDSTYGYRCTLSIDNPNGFDNLTSIGGTHMSGKSDDDVQYVVRGSGSTSNIPSIICEQFKNAARINLSYLNIKMIGANSFRNCKSITRIILYPGNQISEIHKDAFVENLNLTYLDLDSNRLTSLPSGVFRNQNKLTTLDLRNNQLQELPRELFNSSLTYLYLHSNNLTTLHSDSFSVLSKVQYFSFFNNSLNAFDERIIDKAGLTTIHAGPNPCVTRNGAITDNTVNRTEIRAALSQCFENYEEREGEITTTTDSNQCPTGNIINRVCQLEDDKEDTRNQIEVLKSEKQEMRDQIEVLTNGKQEMESQIDDLSSRLRYLEEIIIGFMNITNN